AKMAVATLLMAMVVNAAEAWTRPDVSVMERGKRLQMRIPESGRQGNYIIIQNQTQFARVWSAMDNTTATLPAVDFSRKSLALVWGPLSQTTSTLTLPGKKTGPGRFEVKATVAADSHTSAVIIPQERNADPAYALIEL